MLDTFSIFASTYLWYAIIGMAILYFLTQSRPRQKRMLIFAALVLPLVYIVSMIGGALYDDPRPFVVGHFSPLIPHKPNNGFPSDHVLWSAATAAIIFPSNKYLSLILWLLTILVGAARVHAGIHHPIDIAGSALMAIGVAAFAYFMISRINVLSR
jgi:undecaprenyl-diphosphatase